MEKLNLSQNYQSFQVLTSHLKVRAGNFKKDPSPENKKLFEETNNNLLTLSVEIEKQLKELKDKIDSIFPELVLNREILKKELQNN